MVKKYDELFNNLQNRSNLNEEFERKLMRVRTLQAAKGHRGLSDRTSNALVRPVVKNFITSSTMGDVVDQLPRLPGRRRAAKLQVSNDVSVVVAGALAGKLGVDVIQVNTPAGPKFISAGQVQETVTALQNSLLKQIHQTASRTGVGRQINLPRTFHRAWGNTLITLGKLVDEWQCQICGRITRSDTKPYECWYCHGNSFKKV